MLLLDKSFLIECQAELVTDTLGPARRLQRSVLLEPVAISIITLGEFCGRIRKHPSSRSILVPLSDDPVVPLDCLQNSRDTNAFAQRLGENDAWIAATALAFQAKLAGRERAFTRVSAPEIYCDLKCKN